MKKTELKPFEMIIPSLFQRDYNLQNLQLLEVLSRPNYLLKSSNNFAISAICARATMFM